MVPTAENLQVNLPYDEEEAKNANFQPYLQGYPYFKGIRPNVYVFSSMARPAKVEFECSDNIARNYVIKQE